MNLLTGEHFEWPVDLTAVPTVDELLLDEEFAKALDDAGRQLRSLAATRRATGMADARTEAIDTSRLIEDNLDLVRHVVFQVAAPFPRHVDRDDLHRAGNLGLVEAARRYDADRGVPFAHFAARRIRGAILDAVRAADWAPRSVRNHARQLEAAEQLLATRLGRTPSREEIADELDVTPAEVDRLRARTHRSVLLALEHETTDTDEEDLSLVDVLVDSTCIEPSEELENRELLAYVRDAVRLLPERHRLVVIGYWLEDRTSHELASFLQVTESRVSQLRTEAVEMLREGVMAQFDEDRVRPDDAVGRTAKRKANYADEIGKASESLSRIDDLGLLLVSPLAGTA